MKGNIDIEKHSSKSYLEEIPPTNAFERRSYILKHQCKNEAGYPQYGVLDPYSKSSIDNYINDYKSLIM